MIEWGYHQPILGNQRLPIQGQRPSEAFAPRIELIWSLAPTCRGRFWFDILPDSNCDLVFILGESSCAALFAGPYTRRVTIPMQPGWELVCVRFRPGAAPRFADVHPAELVNGGVTLERVLGMDPDHVGERLKALAGIEARRLFLEDLFRKDLEPQVPDSRSRRCFGLIESCGGRLSVQDLARSSGMSTRTLERVFMEEVGLTPIKVIRYFRYQAALAGLRGHMFRNLSDLAQSCGYADQSHLNKDFVFFSGRSPGKL